MENAYIAPSPRFITTLSIFAKGFPWDKFLQFFKDKQLIACDAEDQIFLLRLLAVQELLCIDDEALLTWAERQFLLIGFLHMGYKANVPSLELLTHFRTTLDAVGILSPFRQQCQKLITLHDQRYPEREASYSMDSLLNSGLHHLTGSETDSKIVKKHACPICNSEYIKKIPPQYGINLTEKNWYQCHFCGNKFSSS
jgi:hypothetical protein